MTSWSTRRQWTGLPTVKLLGLMRGASPISGGGSSQHAALVAAYRADPAARKALDADEDPGALLERLRREDTATGRALNDYLEFVGYRLLDGFDISGRYALEMPDVLLRSITHRDRRARRGDRPRRRRSPRSAVTCRQSTAKSSTHCWREARIGYRVRDERGVYSDIWASGLMRRAAMAAGRRLAERGRLHDAEHFVFADIDEMCAMLEGAADADAPTSWPPASPTTRPTPRRTSPAHIGDAPMPPPDPSQLPPPMQRLMAAVGIAMGEMFGGVRAGARGHRDPRPGRQRRRPRRASSVASPGRRTSTASSRATSCSPRRPPRRSTSCCRCSAAIITDSGGALSHAALVAREYGIPGVVGTRDATERIAGRRPGAGRR